MSDKTKNSAISNLLFMEVDSEGNIVEIFGDLNLFGVDGTSFKNSSLVKNFSFLNYLTGEAVADIVTAQNGIFKVSGSWGEIIADLKIHSQNKGFTLQFYRLGEVVTQLKKHFDLVSRQEYFDSLGKICHDFNNLLAVIMGHAELANYLSDNETARKKHIDEVLNSSFKIKHLLRQVLVYRHHLDSLPPELVDLRDVVDRCMMDVHEQVGKVKVKITEEHGFFVNQSVSKMVNVLGNIILNAAQAIDEKGLVEVILISNENEKFHRIEVKDNGIGMTKQTIEQMYKPFYSTRSRMVAAGVGLTIAKGILDDIGGEIKVDSELGKGTTVRIKIPKVTEV